MSVCHACSLGGLTQIYLNNTPPTSCCDYVYHCIPSSYTLSSTLSHYYQRRSFANECSTMYLAVATGESGSQPQEVETPDMPLADPTVAVFCVFFFFHSPAHLRHYDAMIHPLKTHILDHVPSTSSDLDITPTLVHSGTEPEFYQIFSKECHCPICMLYSLSTNSERVRKAMDE